MYVIKTAVPNEKDYLLWEKKLNALIEKYPGDYMPRGQRTKMLNLIKCINNYDRRYRISAEDSHKI